MVSWMHVSHDRGEAAAPRRPTVPGWFIDARRTTADLDRLRREQRQRDHTRQVIDRRSAARRALMGEES